MKLDSLSHLEGLLNSLLVAPYIVLFLWILQCLLYFQIHILDFINKFYILQFLTYGSFKITPCCCLYTTFGGKGGRYLKKVSKGELVVEVWATLL